MNYYIIAVDDDGPSIAPAGIETVYGEGMTGSLQPSIAPAGIETKFIAAVIAWAISLQSHLLELKPIRLADVLELADDLQSHLLELKRLTWCAAQGRVRTFNRTCWN